MYRRDFLVRTGQVIGAVALTSALRTAEALAGKQSSADSPSWESVRANFNLAPDLIHMAGCFPATPPPSRLCALLLSLSTPRAEPPDLMPPKTNQPVTPLSPPTRSLPAV